MGYLGLTPTTAQQNYLNIDDISGSFNGTTTSFALQVGGVAPTPFPVTNSCLISVGGVVQQPDDTGTDGFRISGGNIIFSSAPGTGEDFFGLVLAGADYLNVGANFPDGTVGNPSITFDSDLNTGIYHPSADSIAITSGGTAALTIDSNRRVGIGTTSPVTTLEVQNSTDPKIRIGDGIRHFEVHGGSATQNTGIGTDYNSGFNFFVNGESNVAATIDSSGRLLIGTDSATTIGSAASRIQSEVTSAQWGLSSVRNTNDSLPSAISFAKSRGTAAGSFTAVQNGDGLGGLYFYGANGSDYSNLGATISAEVDGTPFSGGDTSDLPGRLVFSTASDGSGSATERMRIRRDGNVGIANNGNDNVRLFVNAPVSDSNNWSIFGNNAAGTNAFGVRGDGAIYCGLLSLSPYNLTTAGAANAVLMSDGYFYRSTSSAKYKKDIETIDYAYSEALLNCRPVWYRSTSNADNPEWGWWGFIAEEVASIDPRLVHWKTTEPVAQENGTPKHAPCEPEPEGVAYDRFVPHLLNLIKRQKEQIEAQGTAITALEARLSALEAQ
jgi:hypothetical protein